MNHWTSDIVKILASHGGNLKELAEIAGCDWRTIYRNQSLAGCDLQNQDLRGIDLTGCEIEKAKINAHTRIDPEFDPREQLNLVTRNFYFHVILDDAVENFANKSSYAYIAWAYKNLLARAASRVEQDVKTGLYDAIKESEDLKTLVRRRSGEHKIRRRFQVDLIVMKSAADLQVKYENVDGAALLVLSSLMNENRINISREIGAAQIIKILLNK